MWPSKVEKFNLKSKFTQKILKKKNLDFISDFTATNFTINENIETLNEIMFQSDNKNISIK